MDKKDEWIWRGEDTKMYSVRSIYSKARNKVRGEDDKWFEMFWRIKESSSAQFFA